MITLIMVIGQGSAGKSTFGQKIIQYLNNSVLIRFDDFNKIYHNEKISLELYINKKLIKIENILFVIFLKIL